MFGEPTLTLEQTLWLLSPELVLLLTGFLILGLDAIHPRKEEKHWPPYVALVGLAAALIASITLWGCNISVLFMFSCDPFSLVVKMMAMAAVGLVVLTSESYIRTHSRYQCEFYALLLFATLAICLLCGSTNLIMIFLAFDFLSITSYILTGYLREDQKSTEAAIKYFLYGAAFSALMLYGMSWFYGLTGSTDLSAIAMALMEGERALRPIILPALIFITAGFTFKIAAVPFHQWAPDAFEGAPTPVTAFLSVGPKIGGFAVILRVFLTALPGDMMNLAMDWRALLMAVSMFTMTVGNLIALWQDNIKRVLAYSSIAQAGYILIGAVAASPRGLTAMLFYLIAYVLATLGAFAAVMAFASRAKSYAFDDYAGLGDQAPAAALVLTICLLSLGGIPPMAGFMGKLWLFSAAIEEGLLWLAIIGVINNAISLIYYWKVIRAVCFTAPGERERSEEREQLATSPTLAVALGSTAIGVLLVGILPGPLLSLLQAAAPVFFGG